MKLAIVLSAILGLAAANVNLYPQTACGGPADHLGTKAGTCFNVNALSARGCDSPYVLRLHEQPDCADPYVKQCIPSKCCGLGGTTIKSIKCVRP